ncbi:MAG TPA: hypothetical protein VG496_20440, partial [Myxococcales bacterium]|nr:hypothetical protein [Myxococcales bacterium]
AILCAFLFPGLAVQAQQGTSDAGTGLPQAQKRPSDAGVREQTTPPLSAEDAEVVKQLALLEEVDLLRNLDLFDERRAETTKSPDAGSQDGGPPPAPPVPPTR